jgi:hypothetical protein
LLIFNLPETIYRIKIAPRRDRLGAIGSTDKLHTRYYCVPLPTGYAARQTLYRVSLSATADGRISLSATAVERAGCAASAVHDVSHGIFLLFKLLLTHPLMCRLLRLSTGLSSAITLLLTPGVGN